jgi:starvation-inducible DNA-binding protein
MPNLSITKVASSHLREPIVPSDRAETQPYGTVRRTPLALDSDFAAASVDNLNQLLADTLTIGSLYKKHHWQASGQNFYSIHLLFDKHYAEQEALADILAERIQTLGGVSIATAHDVADLASIPRCPKGREDTETQFKRLLQAHEIILLEARAMARETAEHGDLGTNDIIVSNLIRLNELQVWFVVEHIQ